MNKQTLRSLLVAVMLLCSALARRTIAATGEGAHSVQASCTSGEIFLNEIEYDQPGSDSGEFIELAGQPAADVGTLELHLVASDGVPYRIVPLAGQIDRSGFYVVAAAGVMNTPHKLLLENNFVRNDARHGVGLYDTTLGGYCNFINYEGTVTGFEAWLNIGEDRADDGPERGCAISSSGWWSCNRPTTPGGANGFVAVALRSQAASGDRGGALLHLTLLLGALTLPALRRRR